MAVSEDEVRNLARLAHLELSDERVRGMAGHLSQLLGYVAQLQAVDVDVALECAPAAPGALRADAARPGLPREVATAGSPDAGSGLFVVPRVMASRARTGAEPGEDA